MIGANADHVRGRTVNGYGQDRTREGLTPILHVEMRSVQNDLAIGDFIVPHFMGIIKAQAFPVHPESVGKFHSASLDYLAALAFGNSRLKRNNSRKGVAIFASDAGRGKLECGPAHLEDRLVH